MILNKLKDMRVTNSGKWNRKVKKNKEKNEWICIRGSPIILLGTVLGIKRQKSHYNSVWNKVMVRKKRQYSQESYPEWIRQIEQ